MRPELSHAIYDIAVGEEFRRGRTLVFTLSLSLP